jgi:hypothetical protein
MAWKMASPLSIMLGASPGLPYQAHWCLAQHNGQTLNHASIIQELSPCLMAFCIGDGLLQDAWLHTIGMD